MPLQAAPAPAAVDLAPDGDVRWDPENEEFIEDVVLWGVASWTIGVAVLIAFLIYFMVRCICWICLNDVRPSRSLAISRPRSGGAPRGDAHIPHACAAPLVAPVAERCTSLRQATLLSGMAMHAWPCMHAPWLVVCAPGAPMPPQTCSAPTSAPELHRRMHCAAPKPLCSPAASLCLVTRLPLRITQIR